MNKYERVSAVLKGEKADKIPAGFWYHYKSEFTESEMIKAHLKTFKQTDVDVYKIMQDYIEPIDLTVNTASDWNKLKYPGREAKTLGKLVDVIKGIVDATGHDAYTFQTMFGPLKTIVQTFGYDMVMSYAKSEPEYLKTAVKVVAEAQMEWVEAFLSAGCDGLFYSGQFSEPERFTKDEFDSLVKEGDLIVLNYAEKLGAKNILHICGEPDYQYHSSPSWYVDYPGSIVNWSVKDTGLTLNEGRKLFKNRPILGGMDNRGHILNGTDEQIVSDVNAIISSLDDVRGFMLGADCTIQGKTIMNEKIRVAVDAAHAYL